MKPIFSDPRGKKKSGLTL